MCDGTNTRDEETVVEKSFAERVAEAKAAVPAISPEDARVEQQRDPATLFVDPRDAASIAETTGSIPGSINVPLAVLSDSDETRLPVDLASTARPIIAACQAGPMGALAAHALQRRGYTNVRFVDGGTQGWLDAGFPTER